MDHELSYYRRPDGVTIAYSQAGSGPPLVLVPGWTTHQSYFWKEPSTLLFGPLTQHVTLTTFDKHGCGLSDRDRTDFSLASETYEVEALVDHLGLESFNLMGMSEGGPVAISYAALQVTAKVTVETEGAERPALVAEAIGLFQYDS